MQTSGHADDILNPGDVKSLANFRDDRAPVFSLYLDLRLADDPRQRFDNLLGQVASQKKLDRRLGEYRRLWDEEVRRIRGWLADRPQTGLQAVAVFGSQAAGLWQAFNLPAPVMERLVVADRPYLRPLEILLHEFGCTLVVLIDGGLARLVEVLPGQAAEVDRIEIVPVTGNRPDADAEQFVHLALERAGAIWQANDCARLVLGGSDSLVEALRAGLPAEMRARSVEYLPLPIDAPLDEILDSVHKIERDAERRLEAARVTELLENVRGADTSSPSVLGLEQTLSAVRRGNARLVVVDQDFHPSGGVCPNDGFMAEGDQHVCLLCGLNLRPEPDIIEVALERVLEQSGEIEVLRSPQFAGALREHGHVGALLYGPGESPGVQATAAGIFPTSLSRYDETVEDSFPASDPPGY